MIWLLAAFIFWLMLHGRLGLYAGFVTASNPDRGLASIFKGASIPVSVNLFGSSDTKTKTNAAAPTGAGATAPGTGTFRSDTATEGRAAFRQDGWIQDAYTPANTSGTNYLDTTSGF